MQAVKAIVEDGNVTLQEPLSVKGRVEAILVVLDAEPWDALIRDSRPRPELTGASREALEEFLSGQATPLNPDAMP
ncbi:MAG: hypothetical protein ABR915_11875 [Thermoguttaceae bacterium]